jgi:hypothetical protein
MMPMEVTPFIPLTLRGRFKGRGSFDIQAFGFLPALPRMLDEIGKLSFGF